MQTGSQQHVISQLTDAIYRHKNGLDIWIKDSKGNNTNVAVDNLPKCQTTGTTTQQKAHASQLATKYYNENLKQYNQ